MIEKVKQQSKRGWLTLKRLLLGLLAIICIFGVSVVYRWNQVPDAYVAAGEALEAIPQAERRRMGQHIQSAVVVASEGFALDPETREPLRRGGPDGDIVPVEPGTRQVLRIYVNEANAWLSELFPAWAANQQWALPPTLKDLRIAIVDGKLHLMMHHVSEELDQVFTFVTELRIDDQGNAIIERDRVMGGRQSLPWAAVRSAFEQAGASNPTAANAFIDHLEGRPLPLNWTTRDGRPIQPLEVNLGEDYIELAYTINAAPGE